MISEIKTPKNTEMQNEMQENIAILTKKLEEIERLATQEQGRWANVDTNNTPISVLPFKKIMQIISNN